MRSPGSPPDSGLVFHRGDWLHGMAPADATETSRGILATIGEPYASLRLDAPLDDASWAPARTEQAASWHGLESDGGFRFRWTRESRTTWHGMLPEIYPLRLRIAVPFLNQVRDGFAAACTIEVGGQTLATTIRGTELVAETTLAGGGGECGDPPDPRTRHAASAARCAGR